MLKLPSDLAKQHLVLVRTANELASFFESEGELPADPALPNAVLDFLIAFAEFAQEQAVPAADWQSFLIDFVHAFHFTDADGNTLRYLEFEELDVEGLVRDCCALDEDPVQQLETFLEELQDFRARGSEMSLF